jgi:hypothetical protein
MGDFAAAYDLNLRIDQKFQSNLNLYKYWPTDVSNQMAHYETNTVKKF